MKFIYFLLIICSILLCQIDYGINYEVKYYNGGDDNSDIFENYIDLNIYANNFYFYSFLKYKDPGLIGSPTKEFNDIYDIFFLEYSKDNFLLQVGDLFNSYASGLSYHTFEDRTIDYNNAPRGISLLYYLNNNIELFTLYGENTFSTRTNPAILEPDIFIGNKVFSAGINYQNDYLNLNYLTLVNNQSIDADIILNMKNSFKNDLGYYLIDRYENVEPSNYEMNILEHNLGTTFYLGDLELYFEKSWVYHNKIENERILGYKYYFSSYISLYDYAILYEYKNYNTPYYFSVFSNPPIVFKENASTLISRNLHNVDFSNEVGHHILVNKSYSDQLNIVLSSAFAFRHSKPSTITGFGQISEPGFGKIFNNILKMNNIDQFSTLSPYRQVYLELYGWNKKNNFYYKIGLDNYHEYYDSKIIKAKTLPSQFTFKLSKGNSFSTYFEYQFIEKLHFDPILDYEYFYFSPSYNHFSKWIVSMFYDYEKKYKEGFLGIDITYYLSDNNIISFFLGSQKGGLVCANGTCVVQPDFEDGFKITSRVVF